MSEKKTANSENTGDWSARQVDEFISKFREQGVIVDELSNLKKDRKVYKQQPNSHVFFLADRIQTLSECKKTFDDMKLTQQELQNAGKANPKN